MDFDPRHNQLWLLRQPPACDAGVTTLVATASVAKNDVMVFSLARGAEPEESNMNVILLHPYCVELFWILAPSPAKLRTGTRGIRTDRGSFSKDPWTWCRRLLPLQPYNRINVCSRLCLSRGNEAREDSYISEHLQLLPCSKTSDTLQRSQLETVHSSALRTLYLQGLPLMSGSPRPYVGGSLRLQNLIS